MNALKHNCGFCSTNNHEHCAVVISNRGELWYCPCSCAKSLERVERRTEQAKRNLDFRKSNKSGRKTTPAVQTPTAGASPSHDQTDPETTPARAPRAPRPAAHTPPCRCGCGETTKGGNYRPGHDSRHLTRLTAAYFAARERLEGSEDVLAAGLAELPSDQLRAKLTKAVGGR